ncbi:MAG: response regulator transcription factor [Nostocoides sp.]
MSDDAPRTAPPDEAVVTLLVADDHDLYRRGLQMVLGQDDRIRIVGEASDGLEAVDLAVELVPDVVLLDVRMPRLSGLKAAARIREQVPSARILILTMSDDETDLFEAIKAGANGYLLKDMPGEEVADGILAVAAGQSLIPPSMAAQLLTEFAQLSKRPSTPGSGVPRLTDRELEVLRLIARGQGNRDIARGLFISENTVKNHVRNILDKLQLHSRMEAAMYAVRVKLIDQG